MALLAKSAIREALALGDLKILDTTGTVPESWLMTPRFVMPTNPTTLGDLVQESQCVGFLDRPSRKPLAPHGSEGLCQRLPSYSTWNH